jgi:hypothetical protein
MDGRALVELGRKLRIKPGQQVAVVNAPPECASIIPILGGLDPHHADAVIGFVIRRGDLDLLNSVYAAARTGRPAWVGYPKPGRLATDVHRDWLLRALRQYGVDPVDDVSIDDTWSAVLLRRGLYTEADAADLLAWPGNQDA